MGGFRAFRRKAAQVAGGTALSQGLLILASPVLTRLYTPEDFGVFAVYLSLVSLLGVVASLRYEFALPIPREDQEAAELLVLCLGLVALIGLASGGGLLLGRRWILAWTGVPALGPFLGLVPLSVLGAGLYQVFNCWAIRKGGYGRMARTRVTQGITTLALQLVLGSLCPGPLGLLVGDAAGRSNGTRSLAMLDWKGDGPLLRGVTWGGIRRAAFRFRHFPLLSSGTALMNTLNLRLPAFLLALHFGPGAAGGFILAQRVFALPSSIIGESVAQVYFGEFARLRSQDSPGLMALFQGTIRRMLALGLPLMVLSSLGGWWLFPRLFGGPWRQAGLFVVGIAPMALAQFSLACADSSLLVLERQDLALWREALRSGLLGGAVAGAYLLELKEVPAVFLFGAAGTVAYLGYGAVTWHAIRRHPLRPPVPGEACP